MNTIIAAALTIVLGSVGVAEAQSAGPQANPNAGQNSAIKAPHDMKPAAPAAGHNSFTESQARKHIEKAGYSKVAGLMKDKDGLWQGDASKNGKKVRVALDYQGNVTGK
jgi:hypothetical protein